MEDAYKNLTSLLRRAKSNSDKTGALRRNVLRQLIDATHSSNTSSKSLAANNIPEFFQDFPDLEEDAINAVYDLCEDQSSQVRMDGYRTLAAISRQEKKLVKRNADVLVQLLQSDEPNEVNVVRKTLIEHLHMDSQVTLSVLCDQLVPRETSAGDEESAIRDSRLRALVLNFVSGELKKGHLLQYIPHGSEAENTLIQGLSIAIPKLEDADVQFILKDIVLQLNSFSQPSSHGIALCQAVIAKAKRSLVADLDTADKLAPLSNTRPYFSLMSDLIIDKKVGAPEDLLRFYHPIIGKPVLQRIPTQDQALVIYYLAETLAVCLQDLSLVQSILGVSQFCLECLSTSDLSHEQSHKSCVLLLQAIFYALDGGWKMPSQITYAIQEIGQKSTDGQNQDIQELVRSIASKKIELRQTSKSSIASRSSIVTVGGPRLPSAPIANGQSRGNLASVSTPADNISAISRKHESNNAESPRPPKKAKKGGGESDAVPSLLSRLGTSKAPSPANSRSTGISDGAAQRQSGISSAGSELKVKGAASKQKRSASPDTDLGQGRPRQTAETSLMVRLDSGTPVNGAEEQSVGRRKKWRR